MKISLGTTYYNNPENIISFIENHTEYVDELIIVDDGSADIYHILNYVKPLEKLKLYRVKRDYGFNSHGCRNLIMKEASNEFVILMDSDRMIVDPKHSIEYLKKRPLKRDRLYRFIAHAPRIGSNIHESVNDYLISKTHFFSAGGYDEEWIGYRNGDRHFFEQLKFFGDESILHEVNIVLLRGPTVRMNNDRLASANDIKNPSPGNYHAVMNRLKKPEPNKKILTFEWERLT
jgi:glycosyltransferase involved in cell wall biosynthesis